MEKGSERIALSAMKRERGREGERENVCMSMCVFCVCMCVSVYVYMCVLSAKEEEETALRVCRLFSGSLSLRRLLPLAFSFHEGLSAPDSPLSEGDAPAAPCQLPFGGYEWRLSVCWDFALATPGLPMSLVHAKARQETLWSSKQSSPEKHARYQKVTETTPLPTPTQNFSNINAGGGPEWNRRRKLVVTHVFAKHRVEQLEPLMLDALRNQLGKFLGPDAEGRVFNLRRELTYFAAEFIVRLGLGEDAGAIDIGRALEERDIMGQPFLRPALWDTVPWLGKTLLKRDRQQYEDNCVQGNAMFWSAVNKRWATFDREAEPSDLLDIMLQRVASGELKLQEVVLMLRSDFFAAGTDTSTASMEWVVAQLFNAPADKCRRLQEELDGLDVPDTAMLGQDDLTPEKAPYLHAVVKETLR